MKAAYYLRAQTFEAPSIKHTKVQFTIKSDEDKACRTNIMFDNRVCRGNTYSNPVITEDQKRNQRVYEREQAARLRHQDILRNRQVRRNCKLCFSCAPTLVMELGPHFHFITRKLLLTCFVVRHRQILGTARHRP